MAGLAFWFTPSQDDPCIPVLKREMHSLRSRVESSSAPFEPHATLLASLKEDGQWNRDQYWNKAQQLVQDWRKTFEQPESEGVQVDLKEVCTRGWYFQNVLISLDPTKRLLSLNEAFRKAFDQDHQPEYFPHLSLLYSDLSGEEAQKIIDRMEKDGVWERKSDQGCWFGSKDDTFDKVHLEEVQLWDCNAKVEEWKLLKRMRL